MQTGETVEDNSWLQPDPDPDNPWSNLVPDVDDALLNVPVRL